MTIELPESPEKRNAQDQSDVDWSDEMFRQSRHAGPAVLVRSHRTFHYEGNMKGNVRDGHGVQSYPDGSVYDGEFKKNKFHGRGKLTMANGDWYNGSRGVTRRLVQQPDGRLRPTSPSQEQQLPGRLEERPEDRLRQRSLG